MGSDSFGGKSGEIAAQPFKLVRRSSALFRSSATAACRNTDCTIALARSISS
jgi:hypothetical protein